MERGLLIFPYYQDPLDTELLSLENFLQKIKNAWESGVDTSVLIEEHFMYEDFRELHTSQLELIMRILVKSHERAVK